MENRFSFCKKKVLYTAKFERRMLGREDGEDMNLITYVTDRLGHDARYAIDSLKLQAELG